MIKLDSRYIVGKKYSLVSTGFVCAHLGFHELTIRKRIRDGETTAIKLNAYFYIVETEWLLNLLNTKQVSYFSDKIKETAAYRRKGLIKAESKATVFYRISLDDIDFSSEYQKELITKMHEVYTDVIENSRQRSNALSSKLASAKLYNEFLSNNEIYIAINTYLNILKQHGAHGVHYNFRLLDEPDKSLIDDLEERKAITTSLINSVFG